MTRAFALTACLLLAAGMVFAKGGADNTAQPAAETGAGVEAEGAGTAAPAPADSGEPAPAPAASPVSTTEKVTLVPLTKDLLQNLIGASVDIRQLQFYNSEEITLKNEDHVERYDIDPRTGTGIHYQSIEREEIIIPKETPGYLMTYSTSVYSSVWNMNPRTLGVCFDEDNDTLTLIFRESIEGDGFYLDIEEGLYGAKRVKYGDKRYDVSGVPRLLIRYGEVSDQASSTRELKGRTVTGP